MHVDLEPLTAHSGADKTVWVRLGLSSISFHGGIAVLCVKSDLTSSPDANHLDVFVLEKMSDINPGDVIESVFALIVWGESGSETD